MPGRPLVLVRVFMPGRFATSLSLPVTGLTLAKVLANTWPVEANAPEKLNSDPHGAAWLVKVKLANLSEIDGLMSAADYQAYLGE